MRFRAKFREILNDLLWWFAFKFNSEVFFSAGHRLIVTIGFIALGMYIANLQSFLIPVSIAVLGGMWYLMYKIELGIRARWRK